LVQEKTCEQVQAIETVFYQFLAKQTPVFAWSGGYFSVAAFIGFE
jgi:hypothetical protein